MSSIDVKLRVAVRVASMSLHARNYMRGSVDWVMHLFALVVSLGHQTASV